MHEGSPPDDEARRPAAEVAALLASRPDTRVFDVRTAESREAGATIPGSELLDINARLAAGDMDALLEADLPDDEPIVFVCNRGGKCGRAASFLREQGYDAVAVDGGMAAWQEQQFPVE